ncbi:MAG: LDCC motif putative metal-binding protein [Calditrichia bacterium]
MFGKINKWLEKMAARNEQRYGGRKPDCCAMNRESLHAGSKKPVTGRRVQGPSH